MFWSKQKKSDFNWNYLKSIDDFNSAVEASFSADILLFKHSTRCSISTLAKSRIENSWKTSLSIKPYLIDVLNFREISNEIAHRFDVVHESPQVLVISSNKCLGYLSHSAIEMDEIEVIING
ncbi:MAG: bacillithiol system redox-active protein YtxJ [Crocinitomicaceae bacterium]|nr:bacillithiol system redox-active protein YtxJ [Crocinitomicaceae bacterium]|tara:strand:- start:981 stop:1346 length:366 start_codon:yes stop_codon:yes gene_type:complete